MRELGHAPLQIPKVRRARPAVHKGTKDPSGQRPGLVVMDTFQFSG